MFGPVPGGGCSGVRASGEERVPGLLVDGLGDGLKAQGFSGLVHAVLVLDVDGVALVAEAVADLVDAAAFAG